MKKLLAIISATILTLTLFTSCVAHKANQPISQTPPTESDTKVAAAETTEEAKTTVPEAVSATKKTEREKSTVPEKNIPDTTTRKAEVQKTQKHADTTKVETAVPTTVQNVKISKDEAKNIVLGHAGLADIDISRYKAELDRERNVLVYEIEFDSGKYEYEYEVNADSGKIIKAEKERRD